MRRSWGFHTIVLLAVLAASALLLTWDERDPILIIAFFWTPLALVHALVSTAMVALLRPGRAWVVLGHVLALALAIFAPLFMVWTG